MRDKVAVALLIVGCYAVLFFKIYSLEYSVTGVIPQRYYELKMNVGFDGHGNDINVKIALPFNIERQIIREELIGSRDFAFHIQWDNANRWGFWEKPSVTGHHDLSYSCIVRVDARKYRLPPTMKVPETYPSSVEPYLLPTENIQADSPEIQRLFERLVPPEDRKNAVAVVQAAYQYATDSIQPVEIKGTTDALTALRLGEASCGGKSRLFAAICRAGGVPVRLVGGLILKDGSWRSSHVWNEVWMAGHWIPFCTLNGYFAQVPSHYLVLYYGDEPLFTHTKDINFDYYFHAKKVLAPPEEAIRTLRERPVSILNLWAAFEQVGIPTNLLKIILMIPFGALIVIIGRNVIGIDSFGTFMPALMAVAFRDTGLTWGLIMFVGIIAFGYLVRYGLERFHLLHTPRLGIILTATIFFMMAATVFGVTTGHVLATRVSLFPIVILTLTVERFALMLEEDGPRRALTVVIGTILIVIPAYLVMDWEALQMVVITFPEVLFLVVAAFLVLGRWRGIRLSEYFRFRAFATGD
jgi:hypothetical protein